MRMMLASEKKMAEEEADKYNSNVTIKINK